VSGGSGAGPSFTWETANGTGRFYRYLLAHTHLPDRVIYLYIGRGQQQADWLLCEKDAQQAMGDAALRPAQHSEQSDASSVCFTTSSDPRPLYRPALRHI